MHAVPVPQLADSQLEMLASHFLVIVNGHYCEYISYVPSDLPREMRLLKLPCPIMTSVQVGAVGLHVHIEVNVMPGEVVSNGHSDHVVSVLVGLYTLLLANKMRAKKFLVVVLAIGFLGEVSSQLVHREFRWLAILLSVLVHFSFEELVVVNGGPLGTDVQCLAYLGLGVAEVDLPCEQIVFLVVRELDYVSVRNG